MTTTLHKIWHRKHLLSFGNNYQNLEEEKEENIEPQIQFLYKCISELPETERIIISLELENIKQSEIASIVGLSEVNIRVKIYRIKEKLTQKFKENEQ